MSCEEKGIKRASHLGCRTKEGPTGEGVLSELHTGRMSQSSPAAQRQGMVFLLEGTTHFERLRRKRARCDKRH